MDGRVVGPGRRAGNYGGCGVETYLTSDFRLAETPPLWGRLFFSPQINRGLRYFQDLKPPKPGPLFLENHLNGLKAQVG